jgi:hypothetical protein
MNIPAEVSKYLSKQNLSNWKLELNQKVVFDNIIVIPALNEFENLPQLVTSLELNGEKYLKNTLIIIVVNNQLSENEDIKINNQKLIEYLNSYISNKSPKVNIGFIDASSDSKAFPDGKGGVGNARKLGMDFALKYFDYESEKKKILISLDADCIVSNHFLEIIITKYNQNNINAAVVGYQHILPEDDHHKLAIINYELYLRYYVLSLKYSNSHYAFSSIGSILSCGYESYVKVGGMNRRKGGEDFYFLQKLAKLTDIYQFKEVLVYPSPRVSKRVPFGTGPRIDRFLNESRNEYLLYNPISFEVLKRWLKIISVEENITKPEILLKKAEYININLLNFFKEQNFFTDWNNILKNSKSADQLNKQMLGWLDGFRTLKLIHYLRDNIYQDINMFSAINNLLNKMKINFDFRTDKEIPNVEIQEHYLNLLRTLT